MTDLSTCHEGVDRDGYYQPCDAIAVAQRIDEEGGRYPVCGRHTRVPMVRLPDVIATERTRIATAIEALHYDAPAAKTAQATAARIARGGAA